MSAVPEIAALAAAYGPERTVVTRFVARPDLGGSWAPYFRDWPFALVPDDDPLYDVVAELLTLAGVSTDCCVLSTALPAADAGATIRIAAAACAGSTPENHQRALEAMALFGPQIVLA